MLLIVAKSVSCNEHCAPTFLSFNSWWGTRGQSHGAFILLMLSRKKRVIPGELERAEINDSLFGCPHELVELLYRLGRILTFMTKPGGLGFIVIFVRY